MTIARFWIGFGRMWMHGPLGFLRECWEALLRFAAWMDASQCYVAPKEKGADLRAQLLSDVRAQQILQAQAVAAYYGNPLSRRLV